MKYTVIQPAYFPDIRTLARMYAADVVVWADSFVYTKHSTINRCQIKTANGAQWLTVPVLAKHEQQISDVLVDQQHFWKRTHKKSLEVNYQNSPYYFFFADTLNEMIDRSWSFINELDVQSTRFLNKKLGGPAKMFFSTDLPQAEDRSLRVVQWAEATKCEEYLVEKADLSYIDSNWIKCGGVNVTTVQFTHPQYSQVFGDFYESLSALDLLFNMGESSRMVLKSAITIEGA